MTPHKSLFDLTDEMFLAGTWQIDGQAVAGIEILDRGSDAIEHLAVLADNGKTYTIQGHANLMEDEGEHAWAGWVMELEQRRQVYLQIVANAPIGVAVIPSTPEPEAGSITASSPGPEHGTASDIEIFDAIGAEIRQPDASSETIDGVAGETQAPSLDDMLLVTFAADEPATPSPGGANTEQDRTAGIPKARVRKERPRMSQKHFDVFLMTWPLVFFVVFIFFVVSLRVATETEPMGRWPWLTWVTFGMIGVGYLGMWYGPREVATADGANDVSPPNTRIDG